VALESFLNNGDTVEIFTSKAVDAAPSRDWLGFVKSARARNKIRHWFSKERREAAAETGKAAIARAMRKQGLPLQRMALGDALLTIAQELRYTDLSALYAAVGEGHVSAQSVVSKLVRSAGGIDGAEEDLAETTVPTRPPKPPPVGDSGVVVEGSADVWARLSKCCTPVPGDPITGFVTRGHGVSVHRTDCANLAHLLSRRASGWSTCAGHPGRVAVLVGIRSRRWTGPGCCPTSRGRCPTARQHPVRVGDHDPGPGRVQPVHVRDGRPKHLGAVLRQCARWTASTTWSASTARCSLSGTSWTARPACARLRRARTGGR
jgi:hypothetical protein